VTQVNKPAHTIAPLLELIQNRWSPRVFDTTFDISTQQITSLGEAFRWAPSSSNQQPWRVVFLTRNTELFQQVSESGLTGFNQTWAPTASLYAVILGRQFEQGEKRNQAATYYDLGLASMQMVLQAESMGLRSHFMGGILAEPIAQILGVTEHWVVCVIAVGKQGSIDGVSEELVKRETAERSRLAPESVYLINQRLG
jgi:nitroreductase